MAELDEWSEMDEVCDEKAEWDDDATLDADATPDIDATPDDNASWAGNFWYLCEATKHRNSLSVWHVNSYHNYQSQM